MNNLDDNNNQPLDTGDLTPEQWEEEALKCQSLIDQCFKDGQLDMRYLGARLDLTIESWDWYIDHGVEWQNYEQIIDKVGELNQNGAYQKLFSLIVDKYISLKTDWTNGFSGWSHTLCHTFEKYGDSRRSLDERSPSLLNSRFNQKDNLRLIEESVKRAIQLQDLACVPRIVHPIMVQNLEHALEDDQNFYFRPEILMDPKFIDLYRKPERDYVPPLLVAASPREMAVMVVKKDLQESTDKYFYGITIRLAIPKLVKLLEKLQPELTKNEIEKYLSLAIDPKVTVNLDELKKELKTAESATEIIPGIYIDVEGTLLNDKGKIDERTLEKLKAAAQLNRQIFIVTGGDPVSMTERLRDLQVPEEYFPVKSKDQCRGKILEVLVDDTIPEIQGIKAQTYTGSLRYLPDILKDKELLKLPAGSAIADTQPTAIIVNQVKALVEPLITTDATTSEPIDELSEKADQSPNLSVPDLPFTYIGPESPVKMALEMVLGALTNNKEVLSNVICYIDSGSDPDLSTFIKAMEMLRANPKLRLVYIYFRKSEVLRNLKSSPRIGVFSGIDQIVNIVPFLKKPLASTSSSDQIDQLLLSATLQAKSQLLHILRHDLKDYVIAEKGKRYQEIMDQTRKEFGIKPEADDESVIAFIKNARIEMPEVTNQEIAGVYCDLDDTLIMKDGSLNQETLAKLAELEKAGKEIILWTGGDLDAATKRINSLGLFLLVKYRLVSKYDFTGATAEIIIDNVSLEKFFFQYGIKAKQYIRV